MVKRKRKKGSDMKEKEIERRKGEIQGREKEMEITTKKAPSVDFPLGTFILSRKASTDPHTPFCQHPQLNTALVCTSMQSTSHYL